MVHRVGSVSGDGSYRFGNGDAEIYENEHIVIKVVFKKRPRDRNSCLVQRVRQETDLESPLTVA